MSDPALGSSAVKALHYDPAAYWFESPLNPAYSPGEPSKAFRLGTAFHTLVLDGPQVFKRRYCAEPGPEYMRTVGEISDFVRAKGGKPSRLKAQVIDDALALDPGAKIYDVALANAPDAREDEIPAKAYTSTW